MRTKSVLALLIVLILVSVGVYVFLNTMQPTDPSQSMDADTDQNYFKRSGWLVYQGDAPDANSEWRAFDQLARAEMTDYKGIVWLRLTLPAALPERDPYLFLLGFQQFEAFIDGETVYSFNIDRSSVHIHPTMKIHQIPLKAEDAGKRLEIRMKWNSNTFLGIWNIIGTRFIFLLDVLKYEWSTLVYVTLFLAAGLASALLFLRRKQDFIYLWFALLALSAGIGLMYKMLLLQWLVDSDPIYYWKDLLLPFGFYAFVGFYGEALRLSTHRVFRLMKTVILAYTGLTAVAGWYNNDLYWKLLVDYLPYCFTAVFVTVSIYVFKRFRKNRDRDTLWLLGGYALLVFTVAIYLILNLSPSFVSWLVSLSPPIMNHLVQHELQGGLLVFMMCLAMVMFHRFSDVYRQVERNTIELATKNEELERFHRSLEDIVELRTKELAEANRSLEASVRETAVTLAEVSVLEERNRIAHEIHDVVGHTLTAAIVQLEASKKLAGRDLVKSVEKLDIINGLVRKGLDDIRRSVRLLKDEGETFDLHAALDDLIRDTELTMGVEIDAHIEPLPPLAWLTQRVIYHALQEGLTNGIRHGNCSLFTFTLRREDQRLRFLLINDGTPFGSSKPGFGLTTMMERIHLLGGTVEVGAIRESTGPGKEPSASESSDGAGSSEGEIGCRLEITLPVVAA
jgi:signal transduction histidine kinase